MDGDINCPRQQRLFDFFGEQAFAAGVGERPVQDHISRSAEDFDLDAIGLEARHRRQPAPNLLRLRQRER